MKSDDRCPWQFFEEEDPVEDWVPDPEPGVGRCPHLPPSNLQFDCPKCHGGECVLLSRYDDDE